ncbi:hypothetical protein HORM4_660011 [Vibrio harveyi]|nr:hypothetical protein HORM4_660011 [Vibrio harveyi]
MAITSIKRSIVYIEASMKLLIVLSFLSLTKLIVGYNHLRILTTNNFYP